MIPSNEHIETAVPADGEPNRALVQALLKNLNNNINGKTLLITEHTLITEAHHAAILFCNSEYPIHLALNDELPEAFSACIVQAGSGRVRVDGNLFCIDGFNVLTQQGSACTLRALDEETATALAAGVWLVGACTEYREDLQLPDGSALEINDYETLEI